MVDSLPPNTGGCANGPVVRLLKKYENDEGILKHELEHVKQFWFLTIAVGLIILAVTTFLRLPIYYAALGISTHGLLYLFVKPYRYWCELKAYAVQLQYSEDKEKDLELFGRFISEFYNLNKTKEETTIALKVFYDKY
jgi:hypothetical protein